MKKIFSLVLVLAVFAALLPGCGKAASKTVVLNGTEYKTGFYGKLCYTGDASYLTEEACTVGEQTYRRLAIEDHDWWLGDNGSVYCPAADFDTERAYYANEENVGCLVTFGELSNPLDTLQIKGMDMDKVDSLIKFAEKHSYDPDKPNAKKDQVQCPLPENRDGEAHFYKESADGLFSLGKEHTYYMINGYFIQLYSYGEDIMYVVQVPDDPGAYFVDILNKLGGFSIEGGL